MTKRGKFGLVRELDFSIDNKLGEIKKPNKR